MLTAFLARRALVSPLLCCRLTHQNRGSLHYVSQGESILDGFTVTALLIDADDYQNSR
jgi:hypothetical protein